MVAAASAGSSVVFNKLAVFSGYYVEATLEREIEDLIATFPEEFFPSHGLVLKGRQQSFSGVGRFDLLFNDRYGTNVLMELKAVTAKYENATQLAKYKEALEASGERNILMWLVAPSIPTAVREFLDRIGIEYSEIHTVQFQRVAERHGVKIAPAPATVTPREVRVVRVSSRLVERMRCLRGATNSSGQSTNRSLLSWSRSLNLL